MRPFPRRVRATTAAVLGAGGLATIVLPVAPVRAAGGAHIVDDSEVETPGVCHLETWVTRFVPGDGYLNLAPACTPAEKIPFIELGLVYDHYWDQNWDPATNPLLFGPALKVNFRKEETGLGLGLGITSGVNLRTGELGLASLLMLVTIPIDERVRVNLNAGWSYLRGDTPDAFFWGGQVEAKVGWDLSLMIEGFARSPNGLAGAQLGLRYTPTLKGKEGWLDFDLLFGSYFTPDTSRFFTLGVTVRF